MRRCWPSPLAARGCRRWAAPRRTLSSASTITRCVAHRTLRVPQLRDASAGSDTRSHAVAALGRVADVVDLHEHVEPPALCDGGADARAAASRDQRRPHRLRSDVMNANMEREGGPGLRLAVIIWHCCLSRTRSHARSFTAGLRRDWRSSQEPGWAGPWAGSCAAAAAEVRLPGGTR